MKHDHESSPRPPRVAEPVQVYLRAEERERLARLTKELDTTKSDVLRRGLEALERQITDPAHHPALGVIGIVDRSPARSGAYIDVGGEASAGVDVAREHDRVLSDTEQASWSSTTNETW